VATALTLTLEPETRRSDKVQATRSPQISVATPSGIIATAGIATAAAATAVATHASAFLLSFSAFFLFFCVTGKLTLLLSSHLLLRDGEVDNANFFFKTSPEG